MFDFEDLKIGYYALAAAILTPQPCRVEIAFEKVQSDTPSHVGNLLTKHDTDDMRKLKYLGFTYKEIGEIYGVHENTIYGRLRKRKGREIS